MEDPLERYKALDSAYKERSERVIERIPIGMPGLDEFLSGGAVLGCLYSIEGGYLEQSGKSGLAYVLAGALQKRGKVLWVDTNDDFNESHASNCGLDAERVALCKIREAETALNLLERGLKAGVACVVIDSIGGLIPRYGDEEGKERQLSVLLSRALPYLKGLTHKKGASAILVTQVKEGKDKPIGGPALQCLPDIRLKVGRPYRVVRNSVLRGLRCELQCLKSPNKGVFKTWQMEIEYTEGPNKRLDAVLWGISKNLIHRSGSWYRYLDKDYKGLEALWRDIPELDLLYLMREYYGEPNAEPTPTPTEDTKESPT